MQNVFWGGVWDVLIRGQGDSGAHVSAFHHLREQCQDVARLQR